LPRVEFPAADGTVLEGRLTAPSDASGGAAVLCHPHPRHGGSMDSWMMPVLQRALVSDGWLGLRFNFRGVDGSAGEYERGEGELRDVGGAVDRVLAEVGGDAPVLLAGWSFGAHVSLRYAVTDDRVAGWMGVGLPLDAEAIEVPPLEPGLLTGWEAAKLFVHGSRDQFTLVDRVREAVAAAAEPKRLLVVEGGDHFLATHGDVLTGAARDFGREVLERGEAGR
jgi:alpha/beta superfamily hydrolase